MASGSRAFDMDSAGCNAKLLKSLGEGRVRVHLLRAHPPYQKDVWVRNVLPKYPAMSGRKGKSTTYAVFINGKRKGELCSVSDVEEDKVWLTEMNNQRKNPPTQHSRFDLVLSLQQRSK